MSRDFDGTTYDPERDRDRLQQQLGRVKTFLSDGGWHTLTDIAEHTGDPEASVSARIRDLRKQKFGGYIIERRYVPDSHGLWEYRLIGHAPAVAPPVPAPPPTVDPLRPGAPRAPVEWRCPVCLRPGDKIVVSPLDPNFVTGYCPIDGHQRMVKVA